VPPLLEGIRMPLSECNTTLGWVLLLCTGEEASAAVFLLGGEGSEGGNFDESAVDKAVC